MWELDWKSKRGFCVAVAGALNSTQTFTPNPTMNKASFLTSSWPRAMLASTIFRHRWQRKWTSTSFFQACLLLGHSIFLKHCLLSATQTCSCCCVLVSSRRITALELPDRRSDSRNRIGAARRGRNCHPGRLFPRWSVLMRIPLHLYPQNTCTVLKEHPSE